MWVAILTTSLMTGVFCAAFALVVDVVTEALSLWSVVTLAFVSGFCGSLAAQVVLKR